MLTQTVFHIRSEQDIIDAVKTANKYNVTLRCLGSMHSADPCLSNDMTNGIVLLFDHYADKPGDMTIEEREGKKHYITVKAGTRFEDMVNYIDSCGYALPDLPGIIIQTAAGINGPDAEGGTCPTGLKKGNLLSSSLDKLRVVVPDKRHVQSGSFEEEEGAPDTMEIDAGSKDTSPEAGAIDISRSHPWFGGFRLSFGYLGVISTVTYELQRKYYVMSEEFPTEQAVELNRGKHTGFDWVIHHGKDWFMDHNFARIMLWPFLMECDVWGGNITYEEVSTPGGNPWNWSPFLNWIANILLYFASHAYWFVPFMMKLGVLREGKKVEYNDSWHKVLPLEKGLNRTPLKHSYTEIWLPFEQFDEFMRFIKWYFVENPATKCDLYKPLMPFEIYCSPDATDIWLGPGNRGGRGEGNVRINLIMYERDIRKRDNLYEPFWDALLNEKQWNTLAKNVKFHWGKFQPKNSHDRLKELYKTDQTADVLSSGNMKMFLEVRKRVDPKGILMNDHYNNLLGLSYPPEMSRYEKRVHASYKCATSSAMWFFTLLAMATASLFGLLQYTYPAQEMIPLWQYAWDTCVASNSQEDNRFYKILNCFASTEDPMILNAMQTLSSVAMSVLAISLNAICAIIAIHFSLSSRKRYIYKAILQTATFSNMAFALAEGTMLIKMLDPLHSLKKLPDLRMLLMVYQTVTWFVVSMVGAFALSHITDYCSKDIFQKFEYAYKNLQKWSLKACVWFGAFMNVIILWAIISSIQHFVLPSTSVTFLEVLLLPEYRNGYAMSTILRFTPLIFVLIMLICSSFLFTFFPTWYISIVNLSFAYQGSAMFWSLMELTYHYFGTAESSTHVVSFSIISAIALFFGSMISMLCRIAANKYTAIEPMQETSFVGVWASARRVIIYCWVQSCSVAIYVVCYGLILFFTDSGSVLSTARVVVVGSINFISFFVGVTKYQNYPSLYLSFLELSNVANITMYFVDTDLNIGHLLDEGMPFQERVLLIAVSIVVVVIPFVSLFITESVYKFVYFSRYVKPVLKEDVHLQEASNKGEEAYSGSLKGTQ